MKAVSVLIVCVWAVPAFSQEVEFPYKGSTFTELDLKEKFESGDFTWLEEVAQDYRTSRLKRFPEEWFLATFYYQLAVPKNIPTFEGAKYKKILDNWAARFPDSITWRNLNIDFHITSAWDARGEGYSTSVSTAEWKIFGEELAKAWGLIQDSLNKSTPDPHFYGLAHIVSKGRGIVQDRNPESYFDAPQIEEYNRLEATDVGDYFFKKGTALETGYWEIYQNLLIARLPRWGGARGELEAFMSQAADVGEEEWDGQLYARLYHNIAKWLGAQYLKTHQSIDYPRLIQGYEACLDVPGYYDYWKGAAIQIACTYEDKDNARRLFSLKNGDNPFAGWPSTQVYIFWRTWAFSDDPMPYDLELFTVIMEPNPYRVEELIGPDTDVNVRNDHGRSLMFFALKFSQYDNAEILLKHGATIDTEDALLQMSVGMLDGKRIKFLLDHGLDPNHVGNDGMPLLHRSVLWGSPNGFKHVVDAGADLSTIWEANGDTVLHSIVSGHRNAMLDYLEDRPVDPLIKNKAGLTPLDVAQRAMKNSSNPEERRKFGNSVRKLQVFKFGQ
jgi:hypothetical protein